MRCSACGRVIREHELAASPGRACEHCEALAMRVLGSGIPAYWYEDGMGAEVLEEAVADCAETLADLRLLAWFRRAWTRADGALAGVPEQQDRSAS